MSKPKPPIGHPGPSNLGGPTQGERARARRSVADLLPKKAKADHHEYALRVPTEIWERMTWAASKSECSINAFIVAAVTLATEEVESGKGRV